VKTIKLTCDTVIQSVSNVYDNIYWKSTLRINWHSNGGNYFYENWSYNIYIFRNSKVRVILLKIFCMISQTV